MNARLRYFNMNTSESRPGVRLLCAGLACCYALLSACSSADSELNRFVESLHFEERRIYYITQASSSPPTFILFTNQNKPIHFSFERFLENQLRERFEFIGAPIRFIQRLRKVGKRRVFRP